MLQKLLKLKERIEAYAFKYGFENVDNWTEQTRKDGEVYWKVS